MAKRFRLGLNLFFDNQSNSGVVNYIYNIIAALKTLEDSNKPHIVIFYSANVPLDYLKSIGYPYASYVEFRSFPTNRILQKLNGVVRRITGFNIYTWVKYKDFDKIDCVYPYLENSNFKNVRNKIYWLVDFNNRAFPHHYIDEGKGTRVFQDFVAHSDVKIVLSSLSLLDELKQYYPNYRCKVIILRFASSLPKLGDDEVRKTVEQFNLQVPYIMSPNQFWEHKNQLTVLDALVIVRKIRPDLKFKILFSGSIQVNRGKGLYVDKLKDIIEKNHLTDYVIFSGVLERNTQIKLMKGATALLQPSLYEGWSTLVEEAKALNQFIILSDLPVHREQITENVDFFNPRDPNELAEKMIKQLDNPYHVNLIRYEDNIRTFASSLINGFKDGHITSEK